MNRSWIIALALLIALTASISTLGAGSDFTLGIFGNANMDDTIDEADVALLGEIINGSKEATLLSDADLNGNVDDSDVQLVREIIKGNETEISLIDGANRNLTLEMPLEKIIPMNMRQAIAVIVLGGEEKVIGVDNTVAERKKLFPQLSQLPSVGAVSEPDVEKIVSLKPDLVITFTNAPMPDKLDDKLPEEIAVVRFDLSRASSLEEEMAVLGYLLGDMNSSQKYLKWYDRYINVIEETASKIPEGDKVKVLMEREKSSDSGPSVRWAYANETGFTDLTDLAGGVNIASGHMASQGDLETEFVIEKDPQAIIGLSYKGGYKSNNLTPMKAYYDEIRSVEGFRNLSAVKNGQVHIISGDFSIGPQLVVGVATVAKWLYPDEFQELDPVQAHKEFLSDLMNLNYNPETDGAFVYPP
jgi:iron complex transport system substrate-binding protein